MMPSRTSLIGLVLVIVLLLISILGLVYERLQISDVTSKLSAVQVKRVMLSAAARSANDRADAANAPTTAADGNPLLFALLPEDHHVDGLDEGFAFGLNRGGVA
jgi:hypothetical protein